MARAESLAEELRSTQAALQAVLAEMAAMDGAPPAPAVAKIVVGGGGRQRQQRRTMQQVKRGVLSWAQVAERQWQRMEARTKLARDRSKVHVHATRAYTRNKCRSTNVRGSQPHCWRLDDAGIQGKCTCK